MAHSEQVGVGWFDMPGDHLQECEEYEEENLHKAS